MILKVTKKGYTTDLGESYLIKSVFTCCNYVRKSYIQSYLKYNGNVYVRYSINNPMREIPKWATKKPVALDVEDLTTSTMTCYNKN